MARCFVLIVALTFAICFAASARAQIEQITSAATPTFAPLQADSASEIVPGQALSADGRYVVFSTDSRNLALGDDDDLSDVYLKDTQTGEVVLVSRGFDGRSANEDADDAVVSSDGNVVVFVSRATNLDPNHTDGGTDIYLFDRSTELTMTVSVNPASPVAGGNSREPNVSSDGRYVAFQTQQQTLVDGTDANGRDDDIVVYDRQSASWEFASLNTAGVQADRRSTASSLSRNGRFVVFSSQGENLIDGDTNGRDDVFLRDRTAGVTVRLSVDEDGNEIPFPGFRNLSVSDAGMVVAETRSALVVGDTNSASDVYLLPSALGGAEVVSVNAAGQSSDGGGTWPEINALGTHVSFISEAVDLIAGDDEGNFDVFVRDLQAGVTSRVSVNESGDGPNADSLSPSLSDDGSMVSFSSRSVEIVTPDRSSTADIFVAQVANPQSVVRASEAQAPGIPMTSSDGYNEEAVMTSNGEFVAFISGAMNLASIPGQPPGEQFVQRWSESDGSYFHVDRANNGDLNDNSGQRPDISDDGQLVVFESFATNLADDDDNSAGDVFLYDFALGEHRLISRSETGEVANGGSGDPRMTPDGRYVIFASRSQLVASDTTPSQDEIYRLDLNDNSLVRAGLADDESEPNDLSQQPDISDDGQRVVFLSRATNLVPEADTNGVEDLFLRDLVAETTVRLSVDSSGAEVADRSLGARISGDGSVVLLVTLAQLLPEDTDNEPTAYLYDVATGDLSFVAVNAEGEPADDSVSLAVPSRDGRYVCFISAANNLTDVSTGGRQQVYLLDRELNRLRLVSRRFTGEGTRESLDQVCTVTPDGQQVMFVSRDDLLVPGDYNTLGDVFRWTDDTLFFDGFE